MRLRHHYKDKNIEWAICELNESFVELSLQCSDSSLVKYATENFRCEKRRCQWLASRMLVKQLLGNSVNVINNSNGKPFLDGEIKHISISHTSGYVAVAFSNVSDIGIDIERRSSKIFKVRQRFMGCAEEKALDKDSEETALLLHWSAKESFYKIIGNRGGCFSSDIYVSPFCVRKNGTFSIFYTEFGIIKEENIVYYLVDEDYVFTLSLPCY